MGFSEAVQWWEEWQLRVLVLSSLFLQYFLYFAASLRRRCIPSWFRFIIWLAYLGSDAVAIYALATLFNRHKKPEWVSSHHEDASLEALWAPILLVHLGGVDSITAYNIEDNELWRRHVLTSASQSVVAIYVFRKSRSGDNRLLQAGILIFVAGILKCFEKPLALRSASIVSIMSRDVQPDTTTTAGVPEELYDPFVDRPLRVRRQDKDIQHGGLQAVLSLAFDRLYTKEQVSGVEILLRLLYLGNSERIPWKRIFGYLLRAAVNPMIFAALGLFRSSNKGNSIDVKVTYTLLSCTASLEYIGVLRILFEGCMPVRPPWPDQIAQYNLVGYLASKKKHWILTSIAAFLGCEDYLDPFLCMKPFKRSRLITHLVGDYIETWKDDHPLEVATNRAFNDNRGQWILKKQGCSASEILQQSLQRPFDESVLLWHLATEFCYFDCVDDTGGNDNHRYSRVISNYMAHLLFVNPEMLMTGAEPRRFRNAYMNLNCMLLVDGEERTTLKEKELAKKIIQKLKGGEKARGIADDAWELSKDLIHMCKGDSVKMWKVIEGVWVEMLCFCASRCRGYLHAKSLGKGGEYLSYIWLLQLHMGIETLAEKMQRTSELPEQGNNSASGDGADITTSAMTVKTTMDNENDKAEPLEKEGSQDGTACITPATTVIGDKKGDEDGGSHRVTSAAPATPVIGDENV